MVTLQTNSLELYLNTYKCKSDDEIAAAYAAWAPIYDEQMQGLGWQAPKQIAQLLADVFESQHRAAIQILDVGAGTGLVGIALNELGFTSIDAFDISSEMLAQASARHVYKDLVVGDAGKLSDYKDKCYDALVCVGALNFGHINAQALCEFVSVVKRGGYICFSTREDYYQRSAKTIQDTLVHEHRLELIAEKVRDSSIKDMPHRHWLYRVLI